MHGRSSRTERKMTFSKRANEVTLERSVTSPQPLDVVAAERVLKEAKRLMEQLGVIFFLRQGTCLGAIRDKGFIPWDDDLDIGSVIGLHDLTKKSIDRVIDRTIAAFTNSGYIVKTETNDHTITIMMLKSSTRIDWTCSQIIDDSVFHYPGIRIPIGLFTDLKEIDFIGEKFLVPNPPEEYLRFKYGAEWMTPKKTGYVKDVVEMIPEAPIPGRAGRLRQWITKHVLQSHACRVRVLDHAGEPVSGAEVVVVGLSRSKTNRQGSAKFYLPSNDFYALVIRYDGHEEVLYQEKMHPGEVYVYKSDASSTVGRMFVLSTE
jgi:hypothetical protein